MLQNFTLISSARIARRANAFPENHPALRLLRFVPVRRRGLSFFGQHLLPAPKTWSPDSTLHFIDWTAARIMDIQQFTDYRKRIRKPGGDTGRTKNLLRFKFLRVYKLARTC
jgi:hypothetical protein